MAAFEFAEAMKVQTNIVCRQSNAQCVQRQKRCIVVRVYAYRNNSKCCLLLWDFKKTASCHSKLEEGIADERRVFSSWQCSSPYCPCNSWSSGPIQMGHPHPSSLQPRLAPSDFHLFPELKLHLAETHFHAHEV